MKMLCTTSVALLVAVSACSSNTSSTPSPGASSAPASSPDPTSREAATAAKGAEAVVKRKCVQCHGDNMAGATTPLKNQPDVKLELFPPNLTPDLETGLGDPTEPDPAKRGYTDDLLARAIRNGLDKDDLELCPQMKHFADSTDFEVFSIVKYLRSLPAVKQRLAQRLPTAEDEGRADPLNARSRAAPQVSPAFAEILSPGGEGRGIFIGRPGEGVGRAKRPLPPRGRTKRAPPGWT